MTCCHFYPMSKYIVPASWLPEPRLYGSLAIAPVMQQSGRPVLCFGQILKPGIICDCWARCMGLVCVWFVLSCLRCVPSRGLISVTCASSEQIRTTPLGGWANRASAELLLIMVNGFVSKCKMLANVIFIYFYLFLYSSLDDAWWLVLPIMAS